MKNLTLLTVFLIGLLPTLFSQNEKLSRIEKDIVQVIENESRFFWARDYKNWKKTWVHTEYVSWTVSSRDGIRQYASWKSWKNEVKSLFETNPEALPYDGEVKKYDYEIRIYGDGAWVSFEQDNKGVITRELRIMEKHRGVWKIAMAQIFHDVNEGGKYLEAGSW